MNSQNLKNHWCRNYYFNGTTLIIDAQSVPVEAVGPNKKFSVLEIPVSIGTRQANVLTTPIYLAPLMYDGSDNG